MLQSLMLEYAYWQCAV